MSGVPNRVVSHNAMLAGKLGAKVSWSIQTGKKETETKSCMYQSNEIFIFFLNLFPKPLINSDSVNL